MCGRSSLTTGKARRGWGAASGDPYLLRAGEAEALRLVARQSGPAECGSAWSPDAVSHLAQRWRRLAECRGHRSALAGEPLRDGGVAVAESGAAGLETHGGTAQR